MNEKSLQIEWVDPNLLNPNDWNSNVVTASNEEKLRESIDRFGLFKPIIVRTLADGSLEILGGEHRALAARDKGIKAPIVNLGRIDDKKAKEISLVDNGRYGVDDAFRLQEVLNDLGDPDELLSFMPYSDVELSALMSSASIDLDDLDLDDPDEDPEQAPSSSATPAVKSHDVMRFKVLIDDADTVRKTIERVMKEQNFTEEDSLANAGDALVWIINRYRELSRG